VTTRPARQPKGINSIEVGFRLLQQIIASDRPLPLSRIALAASMSPSKARLYLVSYIKTGLVTQTAGEGYYTLGPAALRMGFEAIRRLDLMHVAQQCAADLVERAPVTILLSVWGSHGPTVVARLSGSAFTEIDFRVGAHLPLTWGATGRVFLAFTPRKISKPRLDKELRSLSQSRSALAISRSKLETILETVRRQGLETVIPVRLSSGMALEGHAAVAAPVLNSQGKLALVMTALFPTNGRGKSIDEVKTLLLTTARTASAIGGWHEKLAEVA
jgi:DNA-binding IclR family transcriptional regulator